MKMRLSSWLIALLLCLSPFSFAQVKVLTSDRIEAAEAWTKGNLLQAAEPEYPAELRDGGVAGRVILKLLLDKTGNVVEALPAEGNEELSKLAIAAVRQWKFRPYLYDNKPVEVETTATVEFSQTEPFVRASKPYQGPVRLRVAQGVADALRKNKVAPVYPYDAKARGIQGDVFLGLTINREGNVENLHLINGDPILAAAALDAVRQWKYKPFLLKGEPVDVETTVKISFRM